MTDRNELRKRCEAATPGPWVNDADGCVGKSYPEGGKATITLSGARSPRWKQDAAFIAAANPAAVLSLIDALDASEARIGALDQHYDYYNQGKNCGCVACDMVREHRAALAGKGKA